VHELGIVLEIVDAASERAGGRRVTRVVIEVGVLTAVLPHALRFCFEAATQGTPLEGACLEIREPPGRARCRNCGEELELLRAFGRCACGCSELDWLQGDELRITAMEVA
jgi:hydrogenase nickel incorporation protein HypA/HybF